MSEVQVRLRASEVQLGVTVVKVPPETAYPTSWTSNGSALLMRVLWNCHRAGLSRTSPTPLPTAAHAGSAIGIASTGAGPTDEHPRSDERI
jgi:hypothetical protein